MQSELAQEARKRLQNRRAELLTRRRRTDTDRTHRIEPLAADSSEQALQLQNDDTLAAIGSAALEEISAIDAALERMARGLYGVCRQCHGEIAAERLHAVPHATTCARCGHLSSQ